MICACQAIDLRGGPKLLSPKTKPFYEWLREEVPYIEKEQPLGQYVESVSDHLLESKIVELIKKGMNLWTKS